MKRKSFDIRDASGKCEGKGAMKVLVAMASYGEKNDRYLRELIREYRSMPYDVDLVVLSNTPKDLGPDIQVIVGLPSKNPWSLPFAHKKVFAERVSDYDLFIFSEDDTLVTEKNIESFLKVTDVLPGDEIAGFIRSEADKEGNVFFSTVNTFFRWIPESVRTRGEYTFAFFTNEHTGCFLLTRGQLRRAIESGGFLVPPHEGRYALLETAATDPYTQCGFKKMICLSHLSDFVVRHLPNKYVGRMGLESGEFRRQIEALLAIEKNGHPRTPLFEVETKLKGSKWSKSYYEPCRYEIVSLIPEEARSVLSVGCGWGATEKRLVDRGMRVMGIPLDSVIAACAEARGVEIIYGDFETARHKLARERFDCILLSNVLHLVRDPVRVLSSFAELLSPQGRAVVEVPNFSEYPILWHRARRTPRFQDFGNYDKTGLHLTTLKLVREWFQRSRLAVDEIIHVVPRWKLAHRLSLGLAGKFLAWSFIAVGKRA